MTDRCLRGEVALPDVVARCAGGWFRRRSLRLPSHETPCVLCNARSSSCTPQRAGPRRRRWEGSFPRGKQAREAGAGSRCGKQVREGGAGSRRGQQAWEGGEACGQG